MAVMGRAVAWTGEKIATHASLSSSLQSTGFKTTSADHSFETTIALAAFNTSYLTTSGLLRATTLTHQTHQPGTLAAQMSINKLKDSLSLRRKSHGSYHCRNHIINFEYHAVPLLRYSLGCTRIFLKHITEIMGILISHLLCDLSGRLVRLAQEFFRFCQHVCR